MKKAGLNNNPIVFLFSDTQVRHIDHTLYVPLSILVYSNQIKSESFLEDINGILNSGDVPNIYAIEDLDTIYNDMKPFVMDAGIQPTKSNLFSVYTKRVRSNIHLVICMRFVCSMGMLLLTI